jgi:Fur family ferric uptake transcriptional regulator
MSHHTLDFAALLRDQGHRLTPQRQLILDAVCEGGGHSTPEEIYERVRAKSSAVNRATVYRTLELLRELRVVVAADMGGGRTVYEIAGRQPHHHLICRTCGAQEELEHDAVKSLFNKIEREYGFKVETNHLALFGQCKSCQRKNR